MKRTMLALVTAALLVISLPTAALAQELLPIEDASMDRRFHPVAPEDGADAVTNPPSLIFWWTGAAAHYTVEMARDPDFTDPITVEGIDLPMYNHTETLDAGTWYWRYFYVNEEGARSEWSPVRSIEITGASIPLPVPPVAEILREMPGHPRIYTTAADLDGFRARSQRESRRAFEQLIRRADGLLDSEPPEVELGLSIAMTDDPAEFVRLRDEAIGPRDLGRGIAFWLQDGTAYHATNSSPGTLQNLSLNARDLALAWLATGERRYAEAAKRWLLYQANFRLDYHQENRAHHDTVHCYPYGLQRMAAVYDSIHEVLTEAEREAVLDAIEYHGQAAHDKLRHTVRIHLRYENSHAQQDMHELLITALAVANDLPAAEQWLEFMIPQYVNRIPYGKDDGGYSEGHYYAYKWHGIVRAALALRTATGIDLLSKPRFTNAPRFWLYCMSLNYWWDHFGDNFPLIRPLSGNGNDRDGMNFLASFYGDRYAKWWADQIDSDLQFPLWYLSDETLPEKPPVDIPQAAAFTDVGWASMYNRFWDSSSARLFFKSSPWGSHGHSHGDQNGFVIHAFGEILAIDKGYYGYYGDRYHRELTCASQSHNTILVNGEGQPIGKQHSGRIDDFFDSEGFSYVVGDAAEAYDGRLDTFLRAIVFIRPDLFIVYDQLEAPEPSTFSWQLNAFEEMELDEAAQTVTIRQRDVRLQATHLLPGDLSYRQSNERPHELRARYTEVFPEHFTAWCETRGASEETRFLTVLEPYRIDGGPGVSDLQAIESDDLIGLSFTRDGLEHTVLFQRDLRANVRASAGGVTTDARAAVVIREGADLQRHFVAGAMTLEVDGRALVSAEEPIHAEAPLREPISAAALEQVNLRVADSDGEYDLPLEAAADPWGNAFYFARIDPREPGRYRIEAGEGAEVFVEDRWDPEHSGYGPEVQLRPLSMVIVRAQGPLPGGAISARLTESYRGRIVNLVRNGGFEVGIPGHPPRGWWVRHFRTGDLSFPHWCDEDPAEGDHCLRVYRQNSRIRAYSQSFELPRAGRYVLRFKAKATSEGAALNTGWSNSLGTSIRASDMWEQYEVEGELRVGRATLHVLFDNAEGDDQTLWVDDIEFGLAPE